MSTRIKIAETYFDGFRASDHAKILACLTDDVVWELPGFRRLEGKLAFDGEIENEAFEGRPKLDTHRMIEGADAVAVLGEGEARLRAGGVFRFAYCTVLTFAGELIRRVDSYVVPLQ